MKEIIISQKEKRIILSISPRFLDRIYRERLLNRMSRNYGISKKQLINQAYQENMELVKRMVIR